VQARGTDRKEHVRATLKAAFKAAYRSRDRRAMNSLEALEEFNGIKYLLQYDDFHRAFPHFLEGILDRPSSGWRFASLVDDVLRLLNVTCAGTDYSWMDEYLGAGSEAMSREESADLAAGQREMFAQFTVLEASAIVEWLRYVRSWKTMDLSRRDLDAALAYWEARASNRQETT